VAPHTTGISPDLAEAAEIMEIPFFILVGILLGGLAIVIYAIEGGFDE
jgi:hypothetical protein